MGIKVANNANATLAASITSSATSITVTSGQGARFPTLSAGDYFYATLIDVSNNLEIVKVTARSTDVLTVTRAQESTTARAYSTGDRIELRLTAQTFIDAALAVVPATISDQSNTSTGYFDLPSGTTAQRPASPNGGMMRHNTTTGYIEYWDTASSSWIGIGAFQATGGTITQAGGYTYHTFTTSSSFQVLAGSKTVEYLIVAGGGGGGGGGDNTWHGGGGGGAGGMLTGTYTALSGNYAVTVGAGGAGGAEGTTGSVGSQGNSSSVFGVSTVGGGFGNGGQNSSAAGNGGSGGGGAYTTNSGGSGTSGQGNNGGMGQSGANPFGGGGGGKGSVGGDRTTTGSWGSAGAGGVGGTGATWSDGVYYAGGGGGGGGSQDSNGGPGGLGGSGGGGNGGFWDSTNASTGTRNGQSGTANRGGGGGGGFGTSNQTPRGNGGSGGSGVVIVRYLT